jgi:membrane associated rhomboid family serine protease
MACRKVQELQPQGGVESDMAKALLDLLDRRYEQALQDLETVINEDPGNAYAHAMRAYLLRLSGQSYDAQLARSRAARLSYGGHFENCFPPVEPVNAPGYSATPAQPPITDRPQPGEQIAGGYGGPRLEQEPVPAWSRPTNMQRQAIRTRFWMSQNPRFVTNILIAINVVIYLILLILTVTAGGGMADLGGINTNVLINAGAQANVLVAQGQVWRIFTAMFLHVNLIHIGLNMLTLYLIGGVVEMVYGKWRYLLIYLASGIVGGIVTYFVTPNVIAVGASGAIFGVFGALGMFYIMNRQALGRFGAGAIMNWLFWLGLNIVFGFSVANIGIWDHIGGLVAGMIIAALLMPRLRRRAV